MTNSSKSFSSEEAIQTDPVTGGKKAVKLEQYSLIPVLPLRDVSRVYGGGALKYDERNWEKGYAWSWSYDALQRHINAFWAGEDTNPDTNIHHLAHAVFHCFALMEWGRTHPEKDNRVKVLSNDESE